MESVLLLVHWTSDHLACVMMGSTEIPELGKTSPEPSIASQEGAKTYGRPTETRKPGHGSGFSIIPSSCISLGALLSPIYLPSF